MARAIIFMRFVLLKIGIVISLIFCCMFLMEGIMTHNDSFTKNGYVFLFLTIFLFLFSRGMQAKRNRKIAHCYELYAKLREDYGINIHNEWGNVVAALQIYQLNVAIQDHLASFPEDYNLEIITDCLEYMKQFTEACKKHTVAP